MEKPIEENELNLRRILNKYNVKNVEDIPNDLFKGFARIYQRAAHDMDKIERGLK